MNHLKVEVDMLRNKNEDLQVMLEKYQSQEGDQPAPVASGSASSPADPSATASVPSTMEISELQESSIRAMRAELTQADDRLREVQAAMAETQAELQRARQRERLNEDHSARLTATVSFFLIYSPFFSFPSSWESTSTTWEWNQTPVLFGLFHVQNKPKRL